MVSPNSVLPPQDAKEQDNASNPSELAYREGMGSGYVGSGIDQVESFANDSKNHDDVRDGEENPDENLDNGLYKPSPGGKRTKFTMKGMFRKNYSHQASSLSTQKRL